jgi:hypothetical protein
MAEFEQTIFPEGTGEDIRDAIAKAIGVNVWAIGIHGSRLSQLSLDEGASLVHFGVVSYVGCAGEPEDETLLATTVVMLQDLLTTSAYLMVPSVAYAADQALQIIADHEED